MSNLTESFYNMFINLSYYCNFVGGFFEGTVILFLIRSLLFHDKFFQSAYYKIYLMGLIIDFSNSIFWCLNVAVFNKSVKAFVFADNLFYWHINIFLGFWNIVLAMNRLFAIVFPIWYTSLWSKSKLTFIIIFILLFPFIINGYTFLNFHCKLDIYSSGCEAALISSGEFAAVTNIILGTISLTLGIITFIKMPPLNRAIKLERQILAHSIYSSSLLTIYSIIQCVKVFIYSNNNYFGFSILITAGNVSYFGYHYIGIAILFFISKTFRKRYFQFFRCSKQAPRNIGRIGNSPFPSRTPVASNGN